MITLSQQIGTKSLIEYAQAFLENECGRPISTDEVKQCIDALLSYSRVLLEIDSELHVKALEKGDAA
jgi:hypothetical protein